MKALSDLKSYLAANDWRTIRDDFLSRETHPSLQFVKYVVAGGMAFAVDIIIFTVLSLFVREAADSGMNQGVRSDNAVVNHVIAFIFAAIFTYVVNVKWVFQPGRHSPVKERVLFFALAAVNLLVGMAVIKYLIDFTGINTFVAKILAVATTALMNYFMRKFFIFKG